MKTYLFHRIRTSNGETVEEFRAVTTDNYQAALIKARVDTSWECVSESEDYASYTRRSVVSKAEVNPLLRPLQDLTKEINLSKLNIHKDFSLINAHACALKAIHNFLA